MKQLIKLTLISIALLGLVIASCTKEGNNTETRQSATDRKVERQILAFKQKLNSNLKTGETMTVDSAVWYMEGLLNYDKANNYHNFKNLIFKKDTLQLPTNNNNSMSMIQISSVYDAYEAFIENEMALLDTTYGVDLVDISVLGSILKDGTITMVMTFSTGVNGSINYTLFGVTDFWYWGWNLGKCGAYIGQNIGTDAADKLQQKFNNPIMAPIVYGWNSDVVMIEADPIQYPDINNQYGDYMIFETSGIGEEPTEEPCLDYNELNYYLSKFDYIKNYNKPSNKSFKSIYVYDDCFLGISYWIRRYYYELYYATPITSLPD
ncbi:MAG: hypothetical protein M0R21_12815 [Lentimicrobiaceae bacterium]|jgi:hypothetical protein|nr:hypothetical protein [Lentimicrobiaceae bacterium]